MVSTNDRDANDANDDFVRPADIIDVPRLDPGETATIPKTFPAPAEAGTYYYIACVGDHSEETNNDNNCSDGSKAVEVTIGGGGEDDDHGNDRSTATPVSPNSTTSGTISPTGDRDYFQVTVSGSGTLTAHTTGSMDNFGRLENSSGTVLVSDDDSGPGFNFGISRSVRSGTYYIRVQDLGDDGTGDYTLHVSFSGDDSSVDLEAGSGSVSNSRPSPGETITVSVPVTNVGSARSSRRGMIFMVSTNDRDANDANDDFVQPAETIDVPRLDPGETATIPKTFPAPAEAGTYYYIACVGDHSEETNNTNNCSDGSKAVEVIIDGGGGEVCSSVRHGPVNRGDQSRTTGSWSSSDCTSPNMTNPGHYTDYYTFTLSQRMEVTIDLDSSIDNFLYLLSGSDATGSVIAYDDDSGSGYDARIIDTLSAGTYTIGATTVSSRATGDYTLYISAGGDDSSVDLEVGSGSASNSRPSPGETITVSVPVTNVGSARSSRQGHDLHGLDE